VGASINDDAPPRATENIELVRGVYTAYVNGDLSVLLARVDPDLEWTYLDPTDADPVPQVCHGRGELELALTRQLKRGLRSEIDEIVGAGDNVMVVLRTPGLDAFRAMQADDRSYFVVTVVEGQIAALRACRNRSEAVDAVG
jgi:ketosteroid isomerase-like protein